MLILLDFLFRFWRRLSGPLQWRLLWLANSKFMVAVSGIIQNDTGEILLLRHRHWVAEVWGLPGGFVHSGECLEDALAREVREETGLAIREIRLVQVNSGFRLRMEVYFRAGLAESARGQPLRLQQQEILEGRFFAPDALPPNMLPFQRRLLESLLFPPERMQYVSN